MATDDLTKKILIDVQLKSDQLKSDVVNLNNTLDQLLVNQLKLKAAGQQNTTQFISLASEIRNTKTEIRNANKEIDNTSKALNAGNNSIAQNRALLSILTSQYVKLSQEHGKNSASTIALGNQINNLTKRLKEQEAQIGQTFRNVGNYTASILQAIPGMGSYASMITGASRAFNVMGESVKAAGEASGGAEATIGGLSGTLIGAAAAVVGVVVAVGAYISALAKLTPHAEAIQRTFSGVGNVWRQMVADFADENLDDNFDQFKQKWADFFSRMKDAYKNGVDLKQQFQDLARSSAVLSVTTAQADDKIADLQLKMRNRRVTPAQEKAYFDQIQKISSDSYQERKKIADAEYDLAIKAATQNRNFTDEQIRELHEKGTAYAAYLDKIHGLANKEGAGTDLAAIAKAEQDKAAAERYKQTTEDRAQNRLDAKNMKAEQAADRDLQKQEEIKQKIAEINSERTASVTKMLEYEEDAFGREISSTNEHYRQLIFKQQQYIKEAEKIKKQRNASGKTKALANDQIKAAEKAITQIESERYSESERLLVEHNKLMIETAAKGALDLKALEIQNIEDGRKRELAGIDNQFKERELAVKKNDAIYQENVRNLNNEITAKQAEIDKEVDKKKKAILKNELQALKTTLNEQNELMAQNSGNFFAYEVAKQKAIDATIKKYADENEAILDQIAILDAGEKKGITGGKDNPFNSSLQSAKQQQLLDEYNAQVSQKGLTEQSKLLIEKEYLAKSKQLKEQNEKDKREIELQVAEQVANTSLTIIENSVKAAAQAKEVQLSKDKQRELANTSLTSAQKLAVENKYRILEGQAKVKEFRQEQKISEAKILISTAEAIAKASPNILLMALAAADGAAQFAIAASQKPPAYAMGGTFKSDGKGAVLPGYSKKDNVNAQLRSGEAVIVSEAARDPYARSLLSSINTAFGGRPFSEVNPGRGYAIGGIVTDGNNSNRYYAQPQEGTQNLANQVAYSLINNFPPVIVDVKDINNEQGILANTVNRVQL